MTDDIESLINKTLTQLGYELVDLEIVNHGELLRIFIDKPNSVNIDDCVEVSNQLNHVLTVEEDVNYERLEVSSPGTDRVLKTMEDFNRFKGEAVKVKCRSLVQERKNFRGVLVGTKDNAVVLNIDNDLLEINFDNIDKARLDPNI